MSCHLNPDWLSRRGIITPTLNCRHPLAEPGRGNPCWKGVVSKMLRRWPVEIVRALAMRPYQNTSIFECGDSMVASAFGLRLTLHATHAVAAAPGACALKVLSVDALVFVAAAQALKPALLVAHPFPPESMPGLPWLPRFPRAQPPGASLRARALPWPTSGPRQR